MGNGISLSFIILTCNSEKTVEPSIGSIIRILNENSIDNYEVLIVDNGSMDDTVQLLEKYSSHVNIKTTLLDGNQGTTVSRNIGLRQSRGAYICIMDSDVVIKRWEILESLSFINSNPSLLAPKLSYPDGELQNSVKRFPTLTAKIMKLPKIFFHYDRFAYLDFYKNLKCDSVRKVDTAISAFWLFPREFIKSVGYLDEKIFYSPEDIDFCVRVQKAGYPIYYYPEIEAIHYTQQISHKNPLSKVSLSHLKGLIYYFYKYQYVFSTTRLRRMIAEMKHDSKFGGA